MTDRRSKFPPLVIDGIDVNESGHCLAEQMLAEIEVMKACAERLVAASRGLFMCGDAGAQLPPDLIDQISTSLSALRAALDLHERGSA